MIQLQTNKNKLTLHEYNHVVDQAILKLHEVYLDMEHLYIDFFLHPNEPKNY